MAKVRNAANTIRQGRIGENTWYVRDGVQVVRQRLQNSNYGEGARRSSAQQERRAKWGNLVNFYKAIKSWQPKAYESLKKGVTDYNAFMQLNANSTPVFLTRQLVEAGGAVVGAYQISKGTLSSLAVTGTSSADQFNIGLFCNSGFTPESTIGQVSSALINAQNDILEGDNLACIWFANALDANGVPLARMFYRELTINTTSTNRVTTTGIAPVGELEANTFSVQPSNFTVANCVGFAVIHTRMDGSILKVSTQSIFMKSETVLNQFTSSNAKAAAIASYGVDGDVPLAPGD